MPKSGSELLFYGLIIAGFVLFNYVMQQLAKKARQQQEAAQAAAGAPAQPPGDERLEDIWGRAPEAPRAAPEPAAPATVAARRAQAPALAHRRKGVHLFRSRKDLRHAIVVMTVLGPCRALDPHERR